jgi:hypothetical protein
MISFASPHSSHSLDRHLIESSPYTVIYNRLIPLLKHWRVCCYRHESKVSPSLEFMGARFVKKSSAAREIHRLSATTTAATSHGAEPSRADFESVCIIFVTTHYTANNLPPCMTDCSHIAMV